MTDFPIRAVVSATDRATAPIRRVARTIRARVAPAIGLVVRAARRATAALRTMLKRLTLLGGVAAVGAAAGLARLVSQTAKANDELAKSSRRAGITAQTYAELRHAFGLAGVESAQFDKAIVKFTRSLGEARAGIGPLTTLLKKTSPALLAQLKATKSNEEALNLFILAMGALEDPSKRAALAAAGFGRAGQQMTLILEKGVEGLREARREFRRYYGEIDGGALKASEDLVDAELRLKTALGGLAQSITKHLLPTVIPLVESFATWVSANRELVGSKVDAFVRGFVEAIKGVDWTAVGSELRELGRFLLDAVKAMGGLKGAAIAYAAIMLSNFTPAVLAGVGALGKLAKAAPGVASKLGNLIAGVDLGNRSFRRFAAGIGIKVILSLEALKSALHGLSTGSLDRGLKGALSRAGSAVAGFGSKLARLGGIIAGGVGALKAGGLAGGVALLKSGLLALAGVVKGAVLGAIGALGAALRGLMAIMLANPITAILTGIAIAATLVITNWDAVKLWFENFIGALKLMWQDFAEWIRGLWNDLRRGAESFFEAIDVFGIMDADTPTESNRQVRQWEIDRNNREMDRRVAGFSAAPDLPGGGGFMPAPGSDVSGLVEVVVSTDDPGLGVKIGTVKASNPSVPVKADVGRRGLAMAAP